MGRRAQRRAEEEEAEDEEEEEEFDPEAVAPARCAETGAAFKIGGPIWSAPIHDAEWVAAALDRVAAECDEHLSTTERIHGVFTAVSEELMDVPLYYTIPDICKTLHCAAPKLCEVRAALQHAGYRSSQSHRDPDAIKTDAPPGYCGTSSAAGSRSTPSPRSASRTRTRRPRRSSPSSRS